MLIKLYKNKALLSVINPCNHALMHALIHNMYHNLELLVKRFRVAVNL